LIRANSRPARLRVLGPPPAHGNDRRVSDDPANDLVSLEAQELRHVVTSIVASAELLDSGTPVD